MNFDILSSEAQSILKEIIDNKTVSDYWKKRFENLNSYDNSILRGYFNELEKGGIIRVFWAGNYPYIIHVLKDRYLYEYHTKEKNTQYETTEVTQFEKGLHRLIKLFDGNDEYKQVSEDWVNDVEIFYHKYLQDHPLGKRIKVMLHQRQPGVANHLVSCLRCISKDSDFIKEMSRKEMKVISSYQSAVLHEYDVFLSHANTDKPTIVDELNSSLEKLGIKIFYDKKSLEWGDNWKDKILDGTQKAEFAIIVISENFFGREWTEMELTKFLSRQNRSGQKLILPIVHNITNEDLRKKYPMVADIQAIDSSKYSCDEIALLFARQLIKRLKVQE